MSKELIIDMLTSIYEIDIDNCILTPIQFIEQITKAITDKNYYNQLVIDYNNYIEFRQS